MGELPSSKSGHQLNNLLNLPETLRKRSSCMVDNLELGAPLGRGSYGKVYKGAALPSSATQTHSLPARDHGADILSAQRLRSSLTRHLLH